MWRLEVLTPFEAELAEPREATIVNLTPARAAQPREAAVLLSQA